MRVVSNHVVATLIPATANNTSRLRMGRSSRDDLPFLGKELRDGTAEGLEVAIRTDQEDVDATKSLAGMKAFCRIRRQCCPSKNRWKCAYLKLLICQSCETSAGPCRWSDEKARGIKQKCRPANAARASAKQRRCLRHHWRRCPRCPAYRCRGSSRCCFATVQTRYRRSRADLDR